MGTDLSFQGIPKDHFRPFWRPSAPSSIERGAKSNMFNLVSKYVIIICLAYVTNVNLIALQAAVKLPLVKSIFYLNSNLGHQ